MRKFFNVHKGIDSSGGSTISVYSQVWWGMIIWEWHLVPKVPLSNNGFIQTHCWINILSCFDIINCIYNKVKSSQKLSLKNSSFSWPTLSFNDSKWHSGFIFLPTLQAVSSYFVQRVVFWTKLSIKITDLNIVIISNMLFHFLKLKRPSRRTF